MESYGWIIHVVEEEWDERSRGDFEDDDHFYGNDYDVDDHDIDNDGEFWRRAGTERANRTNGPLDSNGYVPFSRRPPCGLF